MKKATILVSFCTTVLLAACEGKIGNKSETDTPGAAPDSAAFSGSEKPLGRPMTTKADADRMKNIGPGKDKADVTDSEDKKKHRP
jgi:hypothetical protein